MKRTFQISLHVILLLGLCLCTHAQTVYSDEDIQKLIRDAPSANKYPQAGAAVLWHQIIREYFKDGSSTTEEHYLVKIFEDRAKNEFGDQKRNYNIDSDSIVVLLAQSRKKLGAPIPVEAKAINDITPPELSDASIYANYKQKVISFPALAPNVCIELQLKKFSKPDSGSKHYFWGADAFQSGEPVLKKEVVLITPKEWSFTYAGVHGDMEPAITEKQDKKIYVWRIDSAAQIMNEPYMPPEIAKSMIYSSFPSWDDASQWLAKKFSDKYDISNAMRTKVQELTHGLKTIEEKIRAIYIWNATSVRNVYLPLGIAGFEPNKASVIFDNRYGDYRDKAVLLTALLRIIGVQAVPALVKSNGMDIQEAIPSLRQFDRVYVKVISPRKELWLDPFAENNSYGFVDGGDGSHALLIHSTANAIAFIRKQNISTNGLNHTGTYTINEEGLMDARETILARGIIDKSMRDGLKNKTPKEIDQYFDEASNEQGEGTVVKQKSLSNLKDLTAPGTITWEFSSPDKGIPQGDMMIVSVPQLVFDFVQSGLSIPTLKERKYPFYIRRDVSFNSTTSMKLPSGYGIAYLPPNIELKDKNCTLSQKCTADSKNKNIIHRQRTITWTAGTLSLEEYAKYKKIFDQFSDRKNQIILLKKNS